MTFLVHVNLYGRILPSNSQAKWEFKKWLTSLNEVHCDRLNFKLVIVNVTIVINVTNNNLTFVGRCLVESFSRSSFFFVIVLLCTCLVPYFHNLTSFPFVWVFQRAVHSFVFPAVFLSRWEPRSAYFHFMTIIVPLFFTSGSAYFLSRRRSIKLLIYSFLYYCEYSWSMSLKERKVSSFIRLSMSAVCNNSSICYILLIIAITKSSSWLEHTNNS